MRLTKTDKEAFVDRVMQDVPKVDYAEQLRAATQAAIIAATPPEVQRVYKTHPEYLRSYPAYVYSGSSLGEYRGLLATHYNGSATFEKLIGADAWAKLKAIDAQRRAQEQHHDELRIKLEGVVAGCTTRKALAEALPEFEKYLPPEPVSSKNLPALANVVTDFVKAGWPKGQAAAS